MKRETIARFVGVLGMILLLAGIAYLSSIMPPTEINRVYGKRIGRDANSVNGTAVLGGMFEDNGATVRSALRLSSRLNRSEVLVWTPNAFELPSALEIDYIENNWLALDDGRKRTLIYVARDYEAAIDYWQRQSKEGKGTEHIEAIRQLARAKAEHAYMRSLTGSELQCEWFDIDSKQHFSTVRPTTGPWADYVDTSNAKLSVPGILNFPTASIANAKDEYLEHRVLLGSEETPLIVEITHPYDWPDGRILVLLNGSSILNYPLINHENRKIAARIIDYCGAPDRVTFLESGPGGPTISRSNKQAYSGFEALTVWPINVILLHLIAAGILYCVMVFPIFGRPREIDTDSTSDFGKHVQAIQQLLELSNDRHRAIAKVNQYRRLENETTGKPETNTPDSGNPFKVSQA